MSRLLDALGFRPSLTTTCFLRRNADYTSMTALQALAESECFASIGLFNSGKESIKPWHRTLPNNVHESCDIQCDGRQPRAGFPAVAQRQTAALACTSPAVMGILMQAAVSGGNQHFVQQPASANRQCRIAGTRLTAHVDHDGIDLCRHTGISSFALQHDLLQRDLWLLLREPRKKKGINKSDLTQVNIFKISTYFTQRNCLSHFGNFVNFVRTSTPTASSLFETHYDG